MESKPETFGNLLPLSHTDETQLEASGSSETGGHQKQAGNLFSNLQPLQSTKPNWGASLQLHCNQRNPAGGLVCSWTATNETQLGGELQLEAGY